MYSEIKSQLDIYQVFDCNKSPPHHFGSKLHFRVFDSVVATHTLT